jgi:hypothetical protein
LSKSLPLLRKSKTHIYFVPGLAAGREIFKNISLPEDQFQLHVLEWSIPIKNDTMKSYAKRMAGRITHSRAVLIGVSFGGLMVQEMNEFLDLERLIIISSVKTKYELPKRFCFMRFIGVHKWVPTRFFLNESNLWKFTLGSKSKKKLERYEEYLTVRDKDYIDWAIKQLICWNRNEEVVGVVHIHGDKDAVFPIKHIKNCIPNQGGSHIMIVNKGKWLSRKLVDILDNN